MANTPIGQSSGSAPAIAFDGKTYHMVFVANESSRELLYATSPNGLPPWTRRANLNQSAAQYCAPAAAFLAVQQADGTIANQLVAVFVSNDNRQNILFSVLQANGTWSPSVNINESSNAGVTLISTATGPVLYFVAHNSTHELLATMTASSWPPAL
jgi:hypothetical protein